MFRDLAGVAEPGAGALGDLDVEAGFDQGGGLVVPAAGDAEGSAAGGKRDRGRRFGVEVGGVTDGETAVKMFDDFADLWERAAADGTPVRTIVGDDPVEFAETFVQAYTGRQWIDKERARLTRAIDDAERGERE